MFRAKAPHQSQSKLKLIAFRPVLAFNNWSIFALMKLGFCSKRQLLFTLLAVCHLFAFGLHLRYTATQCILWLLSIVIQEYTLMFTIINLKCTCLDEKAVIEDSELRKTLVFFIWPCLFRIICTTLTLYCDEDLSKALFLNIDLFVTCHIICKSH